MKPYQKPPMEAAVLPATEMFGRPQRPPAVGMGRGPPPHYKSRPPTGLHGPPQPPPHLHHLSASSSAVPSHHYPIPAPRSGSSPAHQNAAKLAKPMARYHPSLSGSETDVSTSTENLTQEEKFVLRHMERQEPQGEENGDPLLTNLTPSSIASTPLPNMPMSSSAAAAMELQMQLQSRHFNAAMSRQQPGLHPPSRPPMTSLDSHNMFPSLPRSLHEELISQQQAKLRGLVPSSSPMLSPMVPGAIGVMDTSMSKLTPSVYSHPTAVQDPVLNKRSGAQGMEMTSSGAFFDHKAVSSSPSMKANLKSNENVSLGGNGSSGSNTDIIAKLTKEMLLSEPTAVVVPSSMPSSTSPMTTVTMTSTSNTSSSSPQSIINKLNLSPAKTKNDLSNADKDLAVLKSSLAAKRAAVAAASVHHHNPSRLSLVGSKSGGSSHDSADMSKSQPDLFTGIEANEHHDKNNPVYANASDIVALMQQHQESLSATDIHQIETLKAENEALRGQLNEYGKKIGRVSSLEQEMAKIHQAYQSLLKHSEKREMLEKSARAKLQAVIINLSDANKEVNERHEAVMSQLMSGEAKNQNIPGLDGILRGEIMRKDGLIRQLMDQNKMLLNTKERQEVEVAALNETLEEQRGHMQFLGSALSNAEANVVRLEEENRLKEGYAERVKQMTRSLDQLQKASEKREAMEKKLRAKLEDELKELREAQKPGAATGDGNLKNGDSIEELRRKLSEAEEKIIRLESERTQWEQRYLEETAMRQVAIDAASIPKDAKIAALEKTSAESEKLIADARNDKMKQFEEMQTAQRKCAEMETAIKTLETTLAERNAAIRILQSKNSASNLSVNNLEEIIHQAAKLNSNPNQPNVENILNIPILNSSGPSSVSPLKKQFSTPSVLATPPQYHSLNLTKKLAHANRSLTPSADMFLRAAGGANTNEFIRSVTPSADILRTSNAAVAVAATPTNAELIRAANAAELLRATPTSSEMHRFSAPADILRATPTSIEMFRATPISAELLKNADQMLRANPGAAAAEMLRTSAPPPTHFDIMRATPTHESNAVNKRREPSGTSIGTDSFQHPGPTLINTADLYNPSLVGGTMPKMSMLREHKSPLANKFQPSTSSSVSAVGPGGNNSNFFDDSIGSFLGPASTATSSSSNIRHEATKSYDGSKSYMEVWRV